jgi:hypothetical protein
LVTSTGQDQLFVFGVPAGLALPPLTAGAPLPVSTVPAEAPLALVVALEGGVLPGAERAPAAAALAGGVPAPEENAASGVAGLNQAAAALILLVGDVAPDELQQAPAGPGHSGDGLEDLLQRIDLYRPPGDLPPEGPGPGAAPTEGGIPGRNAQGVLPAELGLLEGPEPVARPAPEEPAEIPDAVWLDWSPSAARRADEALSPTQGETAAARWEHALLVAAAACGLALGGEPKRIPARRARADAGSRKRCNAVGRPDEGSRAL